MLDNIFQSIVDGITYLFSIIVVIFTYLLMIIYALCFPSYPPEPTITYGEFPISVEYEISGEYHCVEDVVVCEFDGFETYGMNEKKRRWKTTLKSGNERLVLIRIDDFTEIYCGYGSASYYMDDLMYQTQEQYEEFHNEIFLNTRIFCDGEYEQTYLTLEDAERLYNLKIISHNYSKPIDNSFPEK